jgi:preprotein translocase subunit YajC
MNIFFLETSNNGTTGNLADSWPMLLMLVGLFAVSIFMSVIPQRKRRKQMMEMMSSIKVGDEVKTIGGMVGKIVKEDVENGYYVLNVGTEELPTYITITKSAVYVDRVAPVVAEPETADKPDGEVFAEDDAKEGEKLESQINE